LNLGVEGESRAQSGRSGFFENLDSNKKFFKQAMQTTSPVVGPVLTFSFSFLGLSLPFLAFCPLPVA
jgi:hypothetical protein